MKKYKNKIINWFKWQITKVVYPWRLGNALWKLETAIYESEEPPNRKKYWCMIEYSTIIDWVVTIGTKRSQEEFQDQDQNLLRAINDVNKQMKGE